jgi:hypothetical protein
VSVTTDTYYPIGEARTVDHDQLGRHTNTCLTSVNCEYTTTTLSSGFLLHFEGTDSQYYIMPRGTTTVASELLPGACFTPVGPQGAYIHVPVDYLTRPSLWSGRRSTK